MNSMTPVSLQDLDKDSFSLWLDSFDVVLADCDGVLWLHDHLYPRANEAINKFIQMKKKVYLITNNSQMSREDMAKKCQKMNFNLDVSNLISSSYATAEYLKLIKFDKTAYVIGTKVLANEIERVGIQTIGTGPDIVTEDSLTNQIMKDLQSLNEEVGAVVVGFDEHFSYPKLFKAVQYLRDENVKFIATNNDEKIDFPSFTFPETGPILSALENVTGRRATILGKPSKLLKDTTLKQELHRDSNRFLMIGDRLNTDIVFGKESNFQTLLVGTGVHKLEDVKIVANKIKNGDSDESLKNFIPDFYIPAMSDLLDLTNKL